MILSGLKFYYRKTRIDLQGGPKVNERRETDTIMRKRAKLGASQNWFARRRGGATEKSRKDLGWLSQDPDQQPARRLGGPRGPRVARGDHRSSGTQPGQSTVQPILGKEQKEQKVEKVVVSTLLVPYTMGEVLRKSVQQAEDAFCELTGSQRVRIVEKGGDKLANLLCRNDPWAARRTCSDLSCATCRSKVWLSEQKKEARKTGQGLPESLVKTTSNQCRREGTTYVLQCLDCALSGRRSLYQGESSHSARQRHAQHSKDLEQGVATSPLVDHAIRVHGGVRPQVLYLIKNVEPRPLYRAIRESVAIASQPMDDRNLNRCQEWGAPRVPILTVRGGDPAQGNKDDNVGPNPNPVWSRDTLEEIAMGSRKRVRLWDSVTMMEEEKMGSRPSVPKVSNGDQPSSKRRRTATPGSWHPGSSIQVCR